MNPVPAAGGLRRAALPALLCRLLLGGVYVVFGVNKVADPVAFLKALHGYDLLPIQPPYFANLTVVVLPWLEILCGLQVLLGCWLRPASLLLLLLTAFFTVMVTLRAQALGAASGLGLCAVRFDCGCGVGEVWFCRKLAENLLLTVAAAWLLGSRHRGLQLWPEPAGPADGGGR